MNKYLLMSAAAALAATAGTTVANASTTVGFSKDGEVYCNYMVLSGPDNPSTGAIFAGQDIGDAECGTSVFNDAGVYDKKATVVTPGKVKSLKPGVVQFADVSWYVAEKGTDLQYDGLDFEFSYPFGPGGKWAIVASEEGVTAEVLNYGKQIAHDDRRPNSGKSVISDAIQALKLNGK
jgi:hypothetical protein